MTKTFKKFDLQLSLREVEDWLAAAPSGQELRTLYIIKEAAKYGASQMMHHICGEFDTPEHCDLIEKVLDVWRY